MYSAAAAIGPVCGRPGRDATTQETDLMTLVALQSLLFQLVRSAAAPVSPAVYYRWDYRGRGPAGRDRTDRDRPTTRHTGDISPLPRPLRDWSCTGPGWLSAETHSDHSWVSVERAKPSAQPSAAPSAVSAHLSAGRQRSRQPDTRRSQPIRKLESLLMSGGSSHSGCFPGVYTRPGDMETGDRRNV